MLNVPFESGEEQIEALRFYNIIRPSLVNLYWTTYYPKLPILKKAEEARLITSEQIQEINKGTASTSTTLGFGGKDEFNPSKKYFNFAFLLTILPVLPVGLLNTIVKRKWYAFPFKPPFFLIVLAKFLVRVRIKQGWVYLDIIRITILNSIKVMKIKLFRKIRGMG